MKQQLAIQRTPPGSGIPTSLLLCSCSEPSDFNSWMPETHSYVCCISAPLPSLALASSSILTSLFVRFMVAASRLLLWACVHIVLTPQSFGFWLLFWVYSCSGGAWSISCLFLPLPLKWSPHAAHGISCQDIWAQCTNNDWGPHHVHFETDIESQICLENFGVGQNR